ncbi:MAG: hypothetical protein IPM55_13375 [Acidobacteria bacterium]|nr:hypothetical protein [Acidobacteriota bacterium]
MNRILRLDVGGTDNLDQISDARKAIVVLTDGEDESLVGLEETNHPSMTRRPCVRRG